MGRFKFIDLFAGIGGFHHALHNLGGECVFASEIDEYARKTYEHNFKNIASDMFEAGNFNDDIRKVSPGDIPDFDILCAGFPCQPFSQAGYKEGLLDGRNSERGNLFYNIAEIIDAKRPKAFFLENVRGLINHDSGKTLRIIREILEEEFGYSFYYQVVKASDYGLPQLRPRVFMIGFRDEELMRGFSFPAKQPLEFNMSDVFGGNCSREIGFTMRVGGAGSGIHDRRNWDSYLVDGNVVRIQPEHGKMIQGFPKEYEFSVPKREVMKQLGNSVAVNAVQACAKEIILHLDTLDKNKEVETEMVSTKNKGEWTELYSFLKTIHDGEIFFADGKLNVKKDIPPINVKSVSTLNIPQKVKLYGETIDVINIDGGVIKSVPMVDLVDKDYLEEIKDRIINGRGTFEIPEFDIITDKLGITIIKGGNSNQKSDIKLDFEWKDTIYEEQGLGIKSYLGSKPTLLNASGNTNFIYRVEKIDFNSIKEVNAINSRTKIKDRIEKIQSLGGTFSFERLEKDSMNYNLALVDSALPKLMSEMLLNFYVLRKNRLIENLKYTMKSNSIDRTAILDYDSGVVKIKRLMVSVLLGFFAGSKWDGKYTSNGTIVVKDDGEQVAYHIINVSDLEDYLFNEIRFDTPSSSRHRYGSLYRERDGNIYFKLNMQLRF